MRLTQEQFHDEVALLSRSITEIDTLRVVVADGLHLLSYLGGLPPLQFLWDIRSHLFTLSFSDYHAECSQSSLVNIAATTQTYRQSQFGFTPTLNTMTEPSHPLQSYYDRLVSRFERDASFQLASLAALRWQTRKQQTAFVAYVAGEIVSQVETPQATISPVILREFLEKPDRQVSAILAAIRERQSSTVVSMQHDVYQRIGQLALAASSLARLLPESAVDALQDGSFLLSRSEQIACEQCREIERAIGQHLNETVSLKPRTQGDVSTNSLNAAHYPLGGYASIGLQGRIESLLPSQLAYIDNELKPDLFDLKLIKNELLYYARDENETLRKRQTIVVVFGHEILNLDQQLQNSRYQEFIWCTGAFVSAVKKTLEILSRDELNIEIVLLTDRHQPSDHQFAELRILLKIRLHAEFDQRLVRLHTTQTAGLQQIIERDAGRRDVTLGWIGVSHSDRKRIQLPQQNMQHVFELDCSTCLAQWKQSSESWVAEKSGFLKHEPPDDRWSTLAERLTKLWCNQEN